MSLIVECAACESKVDAEVVHHLEIFDDDAGEPFRYSVSKCPACGGPLFSVQDLYQSGPDEWSLGKAQRLWPDPPNYLSWSIPVEVRGSLEEARKCYKATAFDACAVMCGRAIEAICVTHTDEKTLHRGLRALREAEVIDGRLFEWGESLRHERNLGAHATGERVGKEDARDLMDFAGAICEYVYVLSDRYEEYKKRKAADSADKDAE